MLLSSLFLVVRGLRLALHGLREGVGARRDLDETPVDRLLLRVLDLAFAPVRDRLDHVQDRAERRRARDDEREPIGMRIDDRQVVRENVRVDGERLAPAVVELEPEQQLSSVPVRAEADGSRDVARRTTSSALLPTEVTGDSRGSAVKLTDKPPSRLRPELTKYSKPALGLSAT